MKEKTRCLSLDFATASKKCTNVVPTKQKWQDRKGCAVRGVRCSVLGARCSEVEPAFNQSPRLTVTQISIKNKSHVCSNLFARWAGPQGRGQGTHQHLGPRALADAARRQLGPDFGCQRVAASCQKSSAAKPAIKFHHFCHISVFSCIYCGNLAFD